MAEWSQRDYLLQHWQALRVEVDIDLYVGETASAYARMVRALPALRKSFLLKGQYTRAVTADMRGRCAVASSLSVPRESAARLAEARRMARQLERERVPHAALWAVILRAGVASVQGKTDRAAVCLRTAIELAGQLDMSLYSLAARYQLGSLVGGEEREIALADEAMRAAGVVAPKRFAPVLVPGRWERLVRRQYTAAPRRDGKQPSASPS